MHVGCNIVRLSVGFHWLSFLCLYCSAAIPWKMPSGELVMYPGWAGRRAFVPGIIHPCEMECCDTVGLHK